MAQSDDMSGSSGSDPGSPRRPRRFPSAERRATSRGTLDLEPLMTVCPQCGTRFRVTEAQLQAARGRVRCGACGSVFDGVEQLVLDTPPEFSSAHDAERALDELMVELLAETHVVPPPREMDSGGEPPVGRTTADSAQAASEARAGAEPPHELPVGMAVAPAPENAVADARPERPELVEPPAGEQPTPAEPAAAAAVEEAFPGEVAPVPATPSPVSDAVLFGPPRRRKWLRIWPLSVVAVLVITAQILWFRFDVLVRDPAWRPLYAWICGWAGCELPVRRALSLIRTRNLTVQSAGADTGELTVRVLILNEAEFPQAFPVIELRFSELSGAVVAGHRFLPAQYLAGDARNLELMPVRTPVQLELRIPDPGPHAVNYQLDLR